MPANAGRVLQNFNACGKDFLFHFVFAASKPAGRRSKAERDFVSTSAAKENEQRARNHEAAMFFLIAPVPLQ
jgi:hypothetical protein